MKLFKNKRNKDSDKVTQIKIVTQTGNGLYTYGGDVYKSDIVRSCIRPLAAAVNFRLNISVILLTQIKSISSRLIQNRI